VAKTEPTFDLSGGALCLDFANTLADRPRCTKDDLKDYGDLLAFGLQSSVLDEVSARRLGQAARRRPAAARAAFHRAIVLRERLYAVFSSLAQGRDPEGQDLEALNRALGRALRRLRVARTPDGFSWDWTVDSESLDRVLWPVARSAADLLTSDERDQVRECASEACSWLFVDRSRTRRRRWCDMKTCGNRAKARRHYQKKRARWVSTR
jgi:predicted RNA-binding Zn ribbon-like protein